MGTVKTVSLLDPESCCQGRCSTLPTKEERGAHCRLRKNEGTHSQNYTNLEDSVGHVAREGSRDRSQRRLSVHCKGLGTLSYSRSYNIGEMEPPVGRFQHNEIL